MMSEKVKSTSTASSIHISEKDLQSTLNNFLDKEDKKPEKSIWNFKTIAGLAFIFVAFSYIGHLIGSEIFGFESLSFFSGMVQVAPYFAGGILGITCLGMIKSRRKKKSVEQKKVNMQNQRTRDNLDKFLYSDDAYSKSEKKSKTKESFAQRISASVGNKLTRSRTDKRIFGVCGGLAKYFGMSSTALRLIFVAAFFLGYGSFFLVYIAMAIVMPKEPIDWMDDFNS